MGTPFNASHATLEAKPITATTSKLLYAFFYDDSMMADDDARAAEAARKRARFSIVLPNMRTLAEGGVMPPPPNP